MALKKFPVISENGNEYEVKIFFGESITWAGMNVVISKRSKGLFGRVKNVVLEKYNLLESEREVLKQWSYVELAKHFVQKFETDYKEEIEYATRVKRIEKEFEEWDGRI